jgi:membrane-associated protein
MIFTKPDSFWFSRERVKDAERFFERYGALSIILARFIPLVRTFVPVVAGVAHMHYRTFFLYNVVGAVLWASLIPVIGYFAGNLIPDIDRYIIPIVGVVIAASMLPVFIEYLKHRGKS